VKAVTGKPIKFVGVGEKLDKLEEFHPDRMANRILGMGDVVTLVEKAQDSIDAEEAQKMQQKLLRAEFTFEDFLKQLGAMRKMGSLKDILAMIPGVGSQLGGMNISDDELTRVEAIIQSMTARERQKPEIIDAPRRVRIAEGSGTAPEEVSQLLKQFRQMRDVMKAMGSGRVGMQGLSSLMMPGARTRPFKMRSKRKQKPRRKR
jgi:signal recognition particle subunit SRP54